MKYELRLSGNVIATLQTRPSLPVMSAIVLERITDVPFPVNGTATCTLDYQLVCVLNDGLNDIVKEGEVKVKLAVELT